MRPTEIPSTETRFVIDQGGTEAFDGQPPKVLQALFSCWKSGGTVMVSHHFVCVPPLSCLWFFDANQSRQPACRVNPPSPRVFVTTGG